MIEMRQAHFSSDLFEFVISERHLFNDVAVLKVVVDH